VLAVPGTIYTIKPVNNLISAEIVTNIDPLKSQPADWKDMLFSSLRQRGRLNEVRSRR
jgi:hypothetical protein